MGSPAVTRAVTASRAMAGTPSGSSEGIGTKSLIRLLDPALDTSPTAVYSTLIEYGGVIAPANR